MEGVEREERACLCTLLLCLRCMSLGDATDGRPTKRPNARMIQQAEFEKEDIYEDLKRQEEKTDFSKMSKQEAEVLKAELHDKRYVVRVRVRCCCRAHVG